MYTYMYYAYDSVPIWIANACSFVYVHVHVVSLY